MGHDFFCVFQKLLDFWKKDQLFTNIDDFDPRDKINRI